MEDVTDVVFREMFAKYGKPSLLFTEFVSTDGLMHPEGRKKLSIDLKYTDIQRPVVAQIWGRDPEKFYQVAQYVAELGFDAIDINMGCPQSKEIQAGTCAALIREPKHAQEIIRATQKGAGSLPVSVKTRLGYSSTEEMENWLMHLLEMNLPAITLHGRTKKEMSKVPAHWDKIAEAVNIRNREKSETLIIGNGDIRSYQEGLDRVTETGADGFMVGRGAFGNPWFFREGVSSQVSASERGDLNRKKIASLQDKALAPRNDTDVSIEERFRVMVEHAELYEQTFAGIKSFAIMKKHFKAYCTGFPGAAELRAELMESNNAPEVKSIVENFIKP